MKSFARSEIELMLDLTSQIINSVRPNALNPANQTPEFAANARNMQAQSQYLSLVPTQRGEGLPARLDLAHHKIILASKLRVLKSVSLKLSDGARKLLAILEDQHEFYRTGLDMRANLWFLKSRPSQKYQGVTTRRFFIDYGYRDCEFFLS